MGHSQSRPQKPLCVGELREGVDILPLVVAHSEIECHPQNGDVEEPEILQHHALESSAL